MLFRSKPIKNTKKANPPKRATFPRSGNARKILFHFFFIVSLCPFHKKKPRSKSKRSVLNPRHSATFFPFPLQNRSDFPWRRLVVWTSSKTILPCFTGLSSVFSSNFKPECKRGPALASLGPDSLKIKQFLEFFIERDAQNQSEFGRRVELTRFDRADRVAGYANQLRQRGLRQLLFAARLFQAVF